MAEAYCDQENAVGDGSSDDVEPAKEPFSHFTLPEDEFGEMMFSRRLAPEASSSPPSLMHQLSNGNETVAQRQTTMDDTDGGRCFGITTKHRGLINV